MKLDLKIFFIVVLVGLAGSTAFAEAPATSPARPIRILFIGNSYTFYNGGLNAILEQMARSQGKDVQCASSVSGGKSLEWHWNQGKAREALRRGPWSYVVLQDYSLQAIMKPKLLLQYGRLFSELIDHDGAKPIFFMTWARQNQPEKQKTITDKYEQAGRENHAGIAPVGLAWQLCRAKHPEIQLYQKDKSHPTKAGSYLAACVFYDVIFGAPEEPLPNSIKAGKIQIDLPQAEASELQEIALQTVRRRGSQPTAATVP